jgi:hypothetical protein
MNPPDSYSEHAPPDVSTGWQIHMPKPEQRLVFVGVAPGALCKQICRRCSRRPPAPRPAPRASASSVVLVPGATCSASSLIAGSKTSVSA